MPINQQSLEFSDFSGGITDNFIDGVQNKSEKIENLIINKNKKLRLAPGSEILGSNTYQIPTGSERVNGLVVNDGTLFHTALTQLSYTGASSNTNLNGPSGNVCFTVGAQTNKTSFAVWNRHLLVTNDGYPKINKAYKDSGGVWKLRTAGLPALATAPNVATSGSPSTKNYIYAFVYYYTYTVGDSVFEDYGATTEVSVLLVPAPNSNAMNVTSIPVLANGPTLNYDTANIKVKIFRSVDTGTILYYIGEVTNGTTTYNDTTSDATAAASTTLYTTGDVLDNDEPPLAKYIHIANNICWYANVKEGAVVSPNKLRQSIFNDPDSCPELFFDELEDEITGISSVNEKPIVFCKGSIYRLEGFFDELGKGGVTHQKISDSVGCVSHNSIVQANGKVYFAGTDGFYVTDGFQVNRLTDDLTPTYTMLIQGNQQKLNIYGTLDKLGNKIWWGVQTDASTGDNDTIMVFDLFWNAFTTMGNSASFRPTALTYYNNQVVRGDTRGYLLKHDTTIYTNPKIDEDDVPSNWLTETIIYDYRSIVTSFGGTSIRKWVPNLVINMVNESNISVQIISDNDRNRLIQNLALLKYNDNVVWGDPKIVWGTTGCRWGASGLIEEKKRFVASGLRCNYKQIRMTNGYAVIQKSDDFGDAAIDNTTNTATLLNSVVVDLTNNKIDFNDGSDFSATITSGTYSYPYTSLCTEIQTQLDATLSALTFTVSYSTVTDKFTIAGSGAFVLENASGPNAATSLLTNSLGWEAVDTASSASQVANDVVPNYDWDVDAVDYYISFEDDDYDTQFLITSRSANMLNFADGANEAPNGNYAWQLSGYKKGEIFHLLSYALQYGVISKSQKPFTATESGGNVA